MTNDAKATVFVVDDDPAIRDSLALVFEQENYSVRLFESAEEFLEHYQIESFGCGVVDLRMSGMSGLQLQEVLYERNLLLPIIFLTGHGTIPVSVRAMKANAIDFLTKPVSAERLLRSVFLAINESAKMLSKLQLYKDASNRLLELTDRELDVLEEALKGNSNKLIARHLNISHRTVEIHKSKIMQKSGALNLLELAKIVRESNHLFKKPRI